MMELELLGQETIKPSSSTPPELRNLLLSWFDQKSINAYIQLIYFFSKNDVSSGHRRLLKDSLSKALTVYYPFAGRFQPNLEGERHGEFVECNDMGVTFLEAKLPCPMSEVMNADSLRLEEILKLLASTDIMNGKDPRFNPLLSVQLTQFECGGEAMSVSFTHKVVDMASMINFMIDWAAIARSSGHGVKNPPSMNPQFNGASIFPPELEFVSNPPVRFTPNERVCTKRLMFEASKIAALRAMVSDKVENPSRVQLIIALIYKAILSAKGSVTDGPLRAGVVQLTINLRPRADPPLPATFIGNGVSTVEALLSSKPQQREKELWELVRDVKRNIAEFCKKFPTKNREEWASLHKLHYKELMAKRMKPGDQTIYSSASWCNFPLYDVDFGWGKPIWTAVPQYPFQDGILLMDARDGVGVEAMVTLVKEEMAAFEQNEELLSFCQLKP